MRPIHLSVLFRPLSLAGIFSAALGAAGASHAGYQFYSDPALYLAATGRQKVEAFNGTTTDLAQSGGSLLRLDDFAVQGAWVLDAPSSRRSIDGSTNLFIDVSYGGWADIRFTEPLKAFGAWFSGVPASLRVDADSLAGYGSYKHLGQLEPGATESGLQFIGFSADEAFNRIVFEGRGCCSGTFAIDNLNYVFANATAAPEPSGSVPEPASVALLMAGLGAAGLASRRGRSAHRA